MTRGNISTNVFSLFFLAAAVGCGGSQAAESSQGTAGDTGSAQAAPADPNAAFGPLEVGADWSNYTKVNTDPVESGDHGGRFVDTWVNDIGLEAYKNEEAEIPEGSILVKTSWEAQDGAPSTVPGPIFVMKKMAPGFDEDNGDWYYAIHWENPTEKFREKFGQMYWRTPSSKVKYCFDCHNDYSRQLGQVPEDHRAY